MKLNIQKKKTCFEIVDLLTCEPTVYKPMDEIVKGRIEMLDAYNDKGQEYSLDHLVQMPGNPKDWGEIWVEKKDTQFVLWSIAVMTKS